MTSTTRIDLTVPYVEKEDAKAFGARWDSQRKIWYAPPETDLENLRRWLPNGVPTESPLPISPSAQPTVQAALPTRTTVVGAEKGIALTELLGRVKGVIERALPEAVWVRAEISELRGKNGHLFLAMTERNERGDILAQIKGVIFKARAVDVNAKFERATGDTLKTDIKILCLATVRFDPLYGVDLIVEDVDPSYTLGDLAAKLARIRKKLQETGLYDRNRRFPGPVEYVRVAVISPETSAGLGDFRREADRLQRAGLCDFDFFKATFQGVEAPSSIQNAVLQALTSHKERAYDALVVIRGGGSVTDLAWLNDLDLARLIAQSPIPVFTGVGHERDSTILDEIAHRRFDTPSKVALHISSTIKDNAVEAIQAWETINALVSRLVIREKTLVQTQADRIETGVRSALKRVEADQEGFLRLIQTTITAQLREAKIAVEVQHNRLIDGAQRTLSDAEFGIARQTESIAQRAQLLVNDERSEIQRLAHALILKAQGGLDAAGRELDQLKTQVGRDTGRMVVKAVDDLDNARTVVETGAISITDSARKEIENLARIVVGLGPQSTLQRGFAIARDDQNAPLTSRDAALKQASFRVEFRDGAVAVDNQEYEKGERE
jgi:exodeoxyribonuclease VII large subunit